HGHLTALLSAATALPEKAIPFAPTKHLFAGTTTSVNESWRDVSFDPLAQLRRQLVRPFLHHGGGLFPRHLLEQLRGYDERLVTDEDGDLLLRVLAAGYHFVPVPEVNYIYIHHGRGQRVSADDDIAKMQARIRVCDNVVDRFNGEMPPDISSALAQRMDKVAMTYWWAFPQEARALLARARAVSPSYTPDMRSPLRFLRIIGGPRLTISAQSLYRRLRGRPKGGAQG
ncbi:MAG: hypothetical protein AAFO77_08105, partial [Pseudomonadota bacterium]